MIRKTIIAGAGLLSLAAVYGREYFPRGTVQKGIEPMTVEVGFTKTVHIIFRSSIKYVDLGSSDLIAGRAENTENVLRIKAAVKDFKHETNFSVITADGKFYSFNAVYADNPRITNIEMERVEGTEPVLDSPVVAVTIQEHGRAGPVDTDGILASIHSADRSDIRNIGLTRYGIEALLKGLYIHNDRMFFHLCIGNRSFISYQVDYLRFKIIDKKKVKRTAIQETIIYPVGSCHDFDIVPAKSNARAVYAFDKITIPDGKYLCIEIYEKNGARSMMLRLDHKDLLGARRINDIKFR